MHKILFKEMALELTFALIWLKYQKVKDQLFKKDPVFRYIVKHAQM